MAKPADLHDFERRWVNLADPRLGAEAVAASDEFFAAKERMLDPAPPVFIADRYDDHGKWMDGWETRRRRVPGHDWCVVRLGRPGRVRGVLIDTSHFTGNYPPAASMDACCGGSGDPGADASWTEILPATSLQGDSRHWLAIDAPDQATHVRLHIYPDGGVARLRVFGEVAPPLASAAPRAPGAALPVRGEIDLAALVNGGRALAWSDAHYGLPVNTLRPGRGVDMGDGWETRRRREPGADWAIFRLGVAGVVRRIEIDTAHFKGNYPDRCSIQAALVVGDADHSVVPQSLFWPALLPEQPMRMDAVHEFVSQVAELGPVSHVRLNVVPDGGVSRLRLFGTPAPPRRRGS